MTTTTTTTATGEDLARSLATLTEATAAARADAHRETVRPCRDALHTVTVR